MPGFDNTTLFADNVDFRGVSPVVGQITQDGQLLIGSTAAPHIQAGFLTSSGTLLFTPGSGSLSIDVAGSVPTIFKTSSGNATPSGNQLIFANGAGITMAGSGNTVTVTTSNIPNGSLQNSSITLSNGNNISISGSPVSLGGTATVNVSGTTQHAIQIGNATNSLTSIAVGSTGQFLQANTTADPTWSTATLPSTATGTGTILRADGTNWSATTSTYPNTNAINTLLYASSANVMSALTTANNGVLTTGTTGTPVITALATDGQLIIGSSAGAPAAATIGSGNNITVTNGHNTISVAVTGTTTHAIQIGNASGSLTSIAVGTTGQVLQATTTGDPTWSTPTYPSTSGTSGKILISDGTNNIYSTPTYPNTASTALKHIKSDGTNFVTTTVTYPDASVTAGKVIVSDGTNYIASTPTFPNASATSGKFIRSDGTNWIASTPTLPTSAGTSGKVLQSNGTNYIESTPTYPSASGTSRKIIVSDGTNNVYSTETWAVPGSSGNLLSSDGTNWTATLTPSVTSITLSSGTALSTYSEGTWTPSYTRTSLSTTYVYQIGIYTKIGRVVVIQSALQTNTVSNAGSGNLTITALPFTTNATANWNASFHIGQSNISFPTSSTDEQLETSNNSTTVNVIGTVATSGAQSQSITLGSNNFCVWSGCYVT